MANIPQKLQLHGFNNLTKTLSFNIYDICYAKTPQHRQEYLEYINHTYNANLLTKILTDLTQIIDARILNIACQDYQPEGASVTMLIAEASLSAPKPAAEAVVGHLDKSHITVHTYPESHPDNGISTFRADIDVATCGVISPLKALNYLINSFDSDIVIIDYHVRGFTRDIHGRKLFIDHPIDSIQNYLTAETRETYQIIDVNVYQENIFHSKMLLKEFVLDDYLFGAGEDEFSSGDVAEIKRRLHNEMLEIFYGRNIDAG